MRVIHQPAVHACQKRFLTGYLSIRNGAQHRKGERCEHERGRGESVEREHGRLAVGEPDMVHQAPRQQEQRRVGFLDIDRVLVGDLSLDRKQPARKQIRVQQHRDQDRQHETEARARDQSELLTARQRHEIERRKHGTEHQLERHHDAEQRGARDARAEALIVGPAGRAGAKQQRQRNRAQQAAKDRKIAGGRNPFEADERTERAENFERNLAQACAPSGETRQH
ncbi:MULTISPECIES: hypothetical protein [unclassified Bradyrhizobium]|uniref:hypothetical protein n=1 Tax=unclassified Bradyrhizobium TaxID=2631580 RepID=UPI0024792E30|nr:MULTISPECIES: hypothetical protein [unclassified Bradyrhizobium]WGR74213.1 hypothetical protein MTX24_15895 [Bradyrhizobium sp. ISRA426]WGR79048.1 hypothetical protein MTX21_01010 [Bradyrhizobium sp. ISRA430]WGR89452.1 hypothetical protein MTX25_15910 [Bradyrhizobium sp. ISRA432]